MLKEEVINKLYFTLEDNNSSSHKNLSRDDPLHIDYSFEDSKSPDACECGSATCTCKNHAINVIISSNNETFFDMIYHIEDPNFWKKYFIAFRNLFLGKQYDSKIIKPLDMTIVLNKFKKSIKSEITVQNNQVELLQI